MGQRMLVTAVLLAVCSAGTGCTALWTTKETVRADEPPRPVRFESPAVGTRFAEVAKLDKPWQVGGQYTGPAVLPFYLYAREGYLAQSAKFNDAVTQCDTDRDGVITAAEVEAMAKEAKEAEVMAARR